jgi:hypothetical protein
MCHHVETKFNLTILLSNGCPELCRRQHRCQANHCPVLSLRIHISVPPFPVYPYMHLTFVRSSEDCIGLQSNIGVLFYVA